MSLAAKRILVPVGGSKVAEEVFALACWMAKHNKAKIYALYVIELEQELPLDAELPLENNRAEAVLERIEALGREEKCPVDAVLVQARHAGPAIVQDAVDRRIDLITLAVKDKKHFGPHLLGETASYVLKNAPCPVLLWHNRLSEGSSLRA